MSSQTEDTLYEIHTALTESKLWSKFNAQLKKMQNQDEWKWKTVCERQEYALRQIKK